MQRIAIAGKGGSGKTTISGTLARFLGQRLGSLLAVDGDPNPNLAHVIGIKPAENWPLLPADLLERVETDGKTTIQLSRPIQDILDEFSIPGPDGVRLLAMGEVDHAGAG